MKIDCHCHTTCSDGSFTIEERINLIKECEFDAATITDHDYVSMEQVNRARKAAGDMPYVPGIELSTNYRNHSVHLLGYFIDPENTDLKKHMAAVQENEIHCIRKMIREGGSEGVRFEIEELESKSLHTFYAIQFLKRLYTDLSFTKTKSLLDFYRKLRDKAGITITDLYPWAIRGAIDLVHKAGGIAVLAHPGMRSDIKDAGADIGLLQHEEEDIKQYKEWGLDGMEVYTPAHDQTLIDTYKPLAEKYDLLITVGSDCHGKQTLLAGMGEASCYMTWLSENLPDDIYDLYERLTGAHKQIQGQ